MKIVVTGSTGLVGTALVPALVAAGHEVVRLVRKKAAGAATGNVSEAEWHPERNEVDAAALAGCDAAVHLAGENISEGRWTDGEEATHHREPPAGHAAARRNARATDPAPARVRLRLGHRVTTATAATKSLTEESATGKNFVAEVCREWESATEPARAAGIRTVHLALRHRAERRGRRAREDAHAVQARRRRQARQRRAVLQLDRD